MESLRISILTETGRLLLENRQVRYYFNVGDSRKHWIIEVDEKIARCEEADAQLVTVITDDGRDGVGKLFVRADRSQAVIHGRSAIS